MMKMVWVWDAYARDFARRCPSITPVCSIRATVTGTLHLVLVFTLKARAEKDE